MLSVTRQVSSISRLWVVTFGDSGHRALGEQGCADWPQQKMWRNAWDMASNPWGLVPTCSNSSTLIGCSWIFHCKPYILGIPHGNHWKPPKGSHWSSFLAWDPTTTGWCPRSEALVRPSPMVLVAGKHLETERELENWMRIWWKLDENWMRIWWIGLAKVVEGFFGYLSDILDE